YRPPGGAVCEQVAVHREQRHPARQRGGGEHGARAPGDERLLAAADPRGVGGEPGQPRGVRRGRAATAAQPQRARAQQLERLLGPRAIGLYGIVTTTAMTVVQLRRVGIDEAFVQRETAHEEAEFQRAFTVELLIGLAGALLIAALAPVLAAAYGDDRLLALTL